MPSPAQQRGDAFVVVVRAIGVGQQQADPEDGEHSHCRFRRRVRLLVTVFFQSPFKAISGRRLMLYRVGP